VRTQRRGLGSILYEAVKQGLQILGWGFRETQSSSRDTGILGRRRNSYRTEGHKSRKWFSTARKVNHRYEVGCQQPKHRIRVLNLRDGAGSRWDEVGWTELKRGQLRLECLRKATFGRDTWFQPPRTSCKNHGTLGSRRQVERNSEPKVSKAENHLPERTPGDSGADVRGVELRTAAATPRGRSRR